MDFLCLSVAPSVLTAVFPLQELGGSQALVISWMKRRHHLYPCLEHQLR
jgi:hypothetical protein